MKHQDRKKWKLLFVLLFFYASTLIITITVQEVQKNCFPMFKLFTVTAYCPNSCCNGPWAGQTATGKPMSFYLKQGKNICAVDPKVIPLGSVIIFESKKYHCVDVGGKIKGNRIDILLPTHAETVKFGVKTNKVIWKML